MRAAGVITADTAVTAVSFGDLSFNVAVSHRKFPNGGSWSFYLVRVAAGVGFFGCMRARWRVGGARRCGGFVLGFS